MLSAAGLKVLLLVGSNVRSLAPGAENSGDEGASMDSPVPWSEELQPGGDSDAEAQEDGLPPPAPAQQQQHGKRWQNLQGQQHGQGRAWWEQAVAAHHAVVATPQKALHALVRGRIKVRATALDLCVHGPTEAGVCVGLRSCSCSAGPAVTNPLPCSHTQAPQVSQLVLLVLDEAHHAVGDHPYAALMRLLHRPAVTTQPLHQPYQPQPRGQGQGEGEAAFAAQKPQLRVLGLTASPFQVGHPMRAPCEGCGAEEWRLDRVESRRDEGAVWQVACPALTAHLSPHPVILRAMRQTQRRRCWKQGHRRRRALAPPSPAHWSDCCAHTSSPRLTGGWVRMATGACSPGCHVLAASGRLFFSVL